MLSLDFRLRQGSGMVRRLVVALLFGLLWVWGGASPERYLLSTVGWVGMFACACLVAAILIWRDLFDRKRR